MATDSGGGGFTFKFKFKCKFKYTLATFDRTATVSTPFPRPAIPRIPAPFPKPFPKREGGRRVFDRLAPSEEEKAQIEKMRAADKGRESSGN